ncbi:MAG: VOC family protein [Rhodocyclales bacterium GT-UBC]|nr:MAG: VOC family protein [Rhodocyclales bacterium GT-UBC]
MPHWIAAFPIEASRPRQGSLRNWLDHLVINTGFATDTTAELFAALGFTLTPRGYHSLGSINHLIMFAGHYLELIGLPRDGAVLRQEILDSPPGIDGLVFGSADAAATHAALVTAGFQVQPVQRFSRPVEIDGESSAAVFQTVRLLPGQFPAGRIYFCQHETPELVWRPEWLHHQNDVSGIEQLTIVSRAPAEAARRYAELGKIDGGFKLAFVDEAGLRESFGDLAPREPGQAERFAAITFRVGSLDKMADRVRQLDLPHALEAGRLLVGISAPPCLLEFVS